VSHLASRLSPVRTAHGPIGDPYAPQIVTPDAIFADPHLAQLYDVMNPVEDDQLGLVDLVGLEPMRVLDLGCGTGRVALMLAERGHDVVGVDPAAAMLDIARTRDVHGYVRWIEEDARRVDLGDLLFDLIVMTGNVFQVFLTDDDARAVLATARQHLAPGGRLTFESREPGAGEWETWTPDTTRKTVYIAEIGFVEVSYAVVEVRDEFVTFETRHRFPDGSRFASQSTLRFRTQDQIAQLLLAEGFDEVEWWSDWRSTPFTAEALEIVPVARPKEGRRGRLET
jgi:ubiquinone/menaquinone biosynthesis C-methylase UbiE